MIHYLCFCYVLYLRFIYDLRFLWFCICVFITLFYVLVMFCNGFVHAGLCFFYLRFSLPGLTLVLETHGFAREIN